MACRYGDRGDTPPNIPYFDTINLQFTKQLLLPVPLSSPSSHCSPASIVPSRQ